MSFRDESSWVLGEVLVKEVFWVERGMEEANRDIWKTVIVWLLKTAKLLISWVSFSWSYLRNGPWIILIDFKRSFYSRNSLCKFQEIQKLASSFSRVGSYSRLTRENASKRFFQQKWNGLFGKTLNTQNT